MAVLPGWLLSLAFCIHKLHIRADLVWYFFEYLVSEVASGLRRVVLHKLHNLSPTSITHIVSENPIVTIELFHGRKVGFSYAHYNDRARKEGQFDYELLGTGHVMDGTIG